MEFSIQAGRLSAVVSENGAELQSLKHDGEEYLWYGDAAYWTGRSPILFPFVGALDKDGVLFRGERYFMPQHGFARRSKFALTAHTDSSVTLELTDSDATRENYPFRFSLQTSYAIEQDHLCVTFRVENRDCVAMPFCIGAHPAFLCPTGGNSFDDYELVFDQVEQADSMTINAASGTIDPAILRPILQNSSVIPLHYKLFDCGALIFDGLCSKKVTLRNKKDSRSIEMDFSQFPMIGFWSPPGKCAPFLCLEPWVGVNAILGESGRFEDKLHAVVLEPGEFRTFSYTIALR